MSFYTGRVSSVGDDRRDPAAHVRSPPIAPKAGRRNDASREVEAAKPGAILRLSSAGFAAVAAWPALNSSAIEGPYRYVEGVLTRRPVGQVKPFLRHHKEGRAGALIRREAGEPEALGSRHAKLIGTVWH
jgi:hypothetical protein